MEESLLVQAYRGKRGSRPPVWMMRQAGRFLPEYREVRAKHRMLDVIRTPELAAEVTLQPLRRFPLDAAIIFADILNPLIGMGIELDFVEGEGPKIFNPPRNRADIEALTIPDPQSNVGYTLEAIGIVAKELAERGLPVIGFSGSPYTLSCYALGGSSRKNFAEVRKFMLSNPAEWHLLQEKLTTLVSDYLVAQVEAGASAVQLFDSWVGTLAPAEFESFVAPYIQKIINHVHAETNAPLCFFGTGTAALLPRIGEFGADIVGIDWRVPLDHAAKLLGKPCPLQGNLDPLLFHSSQDYLAGRVNEILEQGASLPAHVFNLGHGINPDTPISAVEHMLKIVTDYRY